MTPNRISQEVGVFFDVDNQLDENLDRFVGKPASQQWVIVLSVVSADY